MLAIDIDEDIVQQISDSVTHAVQLDATDENALNSLEVKTFDVAVVAIGDNIQSSIMATILLKELGVKYIIAKGNNDLHEKVLYKISANRVILPEKDMGIRVAHNLISTNILDYMELSKDCSIIEIQVLTEWLEKSLRELKLRSKYGINIIAIKRNDKINLSPSAEDVIKNNDIIVAVGSERDLSKLEAIIAKSN